ncbi:predicted protein, partial [Nematostella vectensis]
LISSYGLPRRSTEFIQYRNHVLCYDQARKIPRWVYEHVTADKLKGEGERSRCDFRPDLNVPAIFQATNEDYLGRGWSRGHMAPAADCRFDQQAMSETFFLSNVVPQDLNNNSSFWYRLESYCRYLTKHYSDVHVVTGPLFLPSEEDENGGKKFVKYEVIGDNNVAVPTHLFKAILAETEGKPALLGAFIVPNQPISFDRDLKEFQVSIEKLSKDSGLVFFPQFPQGKAEDLCEVDGCKLMSQGFMEKIIFCRKLHNSLSLEQLDEIWSAAKESGIAIDKYALETYEKRKMELEKGCKDSVQKTERNQ